MPNSAWHKLFACSLPIHIPQCQKKWQEQEDMKPRSERRKMPQPPSEVTDMALPTSADAIEAFNKRAYKEYEEKTLMTCPYCSRTFKSALNLITHVLLHQTLHLCDVSCFVLCDANGRAHVQSKLCDGCLKIALVLSRVHQCNMLS